MALKQLARDTLDQVGLLDSVRSLRREAAGSARPRATDRFLSQLVAAYRDPLSHANRALAEAWKEDRRAAAAQRAARRFEADRDLLARLSTEEGGSAEERISCVRTMLDRLFEPGLHPDHYERDYLEDVLAIVRGR